MVRVAISRLPVSRPTNINGCRRQKSFGNALDFVWSTSSTNDYAIRESPTSVKVFKNFVEKPGGLDVGFQADGLSGGVLLGVTGQGGVSFFDWATGGLVRRIEVEPRQVSTLLLLSYRYMTCPNNHRCTGAKAAISSRLLATTPSTF